MGWFQAAAQYLSENEALIQIDNTVRSQPHIYLASCQKRTRMYQTAAFPERI
jgi:hypothetical protein